MINLRHKLHIFLQIIGISALIAIVLLLAYVLFCYIRSRLRKRQAIRDKFIKDITEELKDNALLPEAQPIIINHLRDELIPLNQRSALLPIWNEALALLERNDSRVQFGVTLFNGETFHTFKWIDHDAIRSPRGKAAVRLLKQE